MVEATLKDCQQVPSSTRLDAKTGIEVPVEENIDVIEWVPDPAEFIYNAIAPAEVDYVLFDEDDSKRATLWFQITNYLLQLVVVDKTFVWQLI